MSANIEIVSQPDIPKMENTVSGTFQQSVLKLAPLGVKLLQGIVPVKSRKLRYSIGHTKGDLWTTSEHYKYVDEGTRPHVIEGLLVFQIHGVTVFSRNVHHPGTVPQHLTTRTVGEIEKNIPRVVTDLNKVIK